MNFFLSFSRACLGLLWASPGLFGSLSFSAEAADPTNSLGTNLAFTIQFRPAVQVQSEGLFLDQLVAGPDLPHLRLCDSPGFGKSLCLKRTELAAMAMTNGFELPLTNCAGPEITRISRRARALDEKEALLLLSSVLQKEYVKDLGELELRLSRPWTAVSVPDEAFSLKILDIPSSGVAPVFIARFELETASGEHIGSWQASLQAKVWRQVWVAASPLKRGDSLHGADLTLERRDMLQCREALAELGSGDDLLEFTGPVQAGSPIYSRLLRSKPIVRRGQSLVALVQDGAMVITLKVEALEDGASGQIIRVRNPVSRRDLHGKVTDEQKILVSL